MVTEEIPQPQGATVDPPTTQEAGNSAQAAIQTSPSGENLDLEDDLVDYNDVDSQSSSPRNKDKEEAENADAETAAPAPNPQQPAQEDLDRPAALRARQAEPARSC